MFGMSLRVRKKIIINSTPNISYLQNNICNFYNLILLIEIFIDFEK